MDNKKHLKNGKTGIKITSHIEAPKPSKIIVHFKNENDISIFSRLIKQKITKNNKKRENIGKQTT